MCVKDSSAVLCAIYEKKNAYVFVREKEYVQIICGKNALDVAMTGMDSKIWI